ncbi:MAG: Calx-beta domain-containing protein [Verrucomicrobiota bacterium]|nr:Calx-beta domain-containing protein [Verrucomicrobiota bacterium]
MAQAQEIIVYSTDFESFNPRLPLTGQESWVTNDPKLRGSPSGESDGLARLKLPGDLSSRAGYVGGLYRAAYPPGRTNVMLWPEINGLGASLKFEVQMLLQSSDENGNYTKEDAFAWAFLDENESPVLMVAFEPHNDNSKSRSLAIYDSSNAKVELAEEILIAAGNLYDLEVLMEPNYDGLNVNIKMVDMDLNLTIPDCSTHNINAVSANWIMTDARVHDNGIVTGFGSNFMIFDNYTLTSDYSDYITFERNKIFESEGFVNVIAKICKPSENDITINYEILDGTATVGFDYDFDDAQPMSLTIPSGQTSASIEISIIEDMINEEEEYFTINFLNASGNSKLTENKVDVIIANSFIEEPPKITNVAYSKETKKFEITWSSNPGTSYIISSSDNLEQWTYDQGNEVIANHTETTISLSLADKNSQYFRVNIAE